MRQDDPVSVQIPSFPSVEGGGQCETKQVKLDAGKAKCKLRANELKAVSTAFHPPGPVASYSSWPCSSSLPYLLLALQLFLQVQLRVVPLDKAGRQEAWVPEFLFTVEKITGDEVSAETADSSRSLSTEYPLSIH